MAAAIRSFFGSTDGLETTVFGSGAGAGVGVGSVVGSFFGVVGATVTAGVLVGVLVVGLLLLSSAGPAEGGADNWTSSGPEAGATTGVISGVGRLLTTVTGTGCGIEGLLLAVAGGSGAGLVDGVSLGITKGLLLLSS
jgi:hypothetical protein